MSETVEGRDGCSDREDQSLFLLNPAVVSHLHPTYTRAGAKIWLSCFLFWKISVEVMVVTQRKVNCCLQVRDESLNASGLTTSGCLLSC